MTVTRNSVPRREEVWHWKPTSPTQAAEAERDMLQALPVPFRQTLVPVRGGTLNTVQAGSGPALVLLHGMAAALGFWVANIPALTPRHTVYALDLPGFGRSTRFPFEGATVAEAEDYFVDALEEWREQVEIDQMVLLGHSMGGYLSAVYALKYPKRVSHLILADPWGVPHRTPPKPDFPCYLRVVAEIVTKFNPLAVVRATGPWGPDLIHKFRKDIAKKFAPVLSDPSLVLDYIYHMNADEPTGETAFSTMSSRLAWAKEPLVDRLEALDPAVRVSFLYGADSWMDHKVGAAVAEALGPRATCTVIPGAGHHVYIDAMEAFNAAVLAELGGEDTSPLG